MSEWQPIETAPKDGSRILIGAWRTGRNHTLRNWHVYVAKWWKLYGFWACYPGGVQFWPTHWQPMPDPPEAA